MMRRFMSHRSSTIESFAGSSIHAFSAGVTEICPFVDFFDLASSTLRIVGSAFFHAS